MAKFPGVGNVVKYSPVCIGSEEDSYGGVELGGYAGGGYECL